MRFSTLFAVAATVVSVVSAAPQPHAEPELDSRDLSLAQIINLLGIGLVSKVDTFILLSTFEDNEVAVDFDVKNPLPIELTLDSVTTSASLNGTTYTSFTHTFSPPLVVAPLGTKNSGRINNVLLTQGLTASLDIVPFGVLDLNSNAKVRAATILGHLGIPISLDGLKQKNVPTSYTFDLS
ncbi:hypothetical protein D9619_004315 [Psilocybe cf. subviscida]|uniref:Late embryogenesis abundant protein LEA-2 subgroup domain-containing protein n=1 Tax=Psilocybe cf. subviscida TaxID=2480587 RepID=A0A8H5BP79_9AGAR|nr:hypothetical protein D9619_004315 [Psilocybe cf. subviscida]